MAAGEEMLNRKIMNKKVMITQGCFVNYQLNQSCYCDYNGVFLQDNWRQKDLENKERKSTEIWHEKNSSDKYT